jgi:hypothetical protein
MNPAPEARHHEMHELRESAPGTTAEGPEWFGSRLGGLWRKVLDCVIPRPPRFAKYRPALRIGTRRIESRLLQRLNCASAETAR